MLILFAAFRVGGGFGVRKCRFGSCSARLCSQEASRAWRRHCSEFVASSRRLFGLCNHPVSPAVRRSMRCDVARMFVDEAGCC